MLSLLVFGRPRRRAGQGESYYTDWLDALMSHPGVAARVVDTSSSTALVYGLARARRRAWDVIVYPYGFFYETSTSRQRAILTLLGELRGTKVFFLENEYRFLREKLAYASLLGADYITSQLPKDNADLAYGALFPPSRIISLAHGLAVSGGADEDAASARTVDLGFRGTAYPYYIGHRDRELITGYFAERAAALGLTTDIRLDERLDRTAWRAFLRRCRGILGHDAGTEYLELNDVVRDRIGRYQAEHPGATFEEVQRLFFKDFRNPVNARCISSRHFDAIGTRTCQLMFPGRYNDILKADVHYIAVERDFSNVRDAVARFRDEAYRRRMVEDTYSYVRDAHTLRHRVAELLRGIGL
ncbi:MAG: glycosyltransferase family 1 protein [Candidatus Rokubacteria bacterium]|nr:glycosyltransferase family 1 protein [Candidatus Rokubacteria bacterium]